MNVLANRVRVPYTIILLASVVALTALLTLSPVRAVHAASSPSQQSTVHKPLHISPNASCSGTGCDGWDPVSSGCQSGSYVVSTAYFTGGRVELRYGPNCGTNWAVVYNSSSDGNASMIAYVVRQSDSRHGGAQAGGGNASATMSSAMVYAPSTPAQACGTIDGHSNCTAFF